MQNLLTFLTRIGDKLHEIVNIPLAWISGFGLFVLDALTGGKLIIYIVILASTIDLICGIAVAIKRKEFTRSDLMRRTVEKLLVYGLVLLVFLCVDHVIERETSFTTDLTSGFVGVLMTLTESVSFTASLIILFPNNNFLHMFQKSLTGELASKLNCDEAEVEKILAKSRRAKRQPRGKDGRFHSKKKSTGVSHNKQAD